jgi:hypothetical protein
MIKKIEEKLKRQLMKQLKKLVSKVKQEDYRKMIS